MPSKSKKTAAVQANPPQASQTEFPMSQQPQHASNPTPSSVQPVAAPNGQKPQTNLQHTDLPHDSTSVTSAGPAVNRKKQKRREKEAAKRAAGQHLSNGHEPSEANVNGGIPSIDQRRGPVKGYFTEETDYVHPDFAEDAGDYDDQFYSGDDDPDYSPDMRAHPPSWPSGVGGNNRRKVHGQDALYTTPSNLSRTSANAARGHLGRPPPLSAAAIRSAHKMSSESIWNTSTQAERENIKQFWLELGEDERRSLVKVEKEAVLRKMKEQQKHSCSCSVCGRKRTAIEEELEVLYDAYYEELEQFANHNHDLSNTPQMMAQPRTYKQLRPPPMAGSYPSRGRVHELGEGEDGHEDEEEYEDDDEPYSDEDLDDLPPGPPDFFTFGNSLTVKDGILTVADDLLKNDGKHFIDMMEQLAERRMQREEEIHYPSTALAHQDIHQGHNHPPSDEDEEDYDDDDDEEYDSQEEDDFEGDEMDSMTEEQRMEEGRRMFQIFAARMFEQRVLTAYREKVARERQQKLLEELDEENRLDNQREAKKAREAAKKKEKKQAQKQAKAEEKAKKEADKAAQEAAVKEAEERRLEEQRQRKEEQKRKRDAERKAAEEDRLRKEADKQRRAQEERERQAEMERKQKEAREREKKKRDESKKKEREEKEARDRKLKEDQERRAKEEQLRKEKELSTKQEKDAKARDQAARRHPVALPPGLHPPAHTSQAQSPYSQVATPIMPPKIPTPGARNRQTSQPSQQSYSSSPRSLHAQTEASRKSVSPPVQAMPQTPNASNGFAKAQGQPPMLHHPQPSAPLSPLSSQGRGSQQHFSMSGIPGLGMNGPPMSGPPGIHSMAPPPQMYPGPPMGNPQRFGPPHGMPYPPGFSGPRPFQPNAMPFMNQAPMLPPGTVPQGHAIKPPAHSRQPSETFQEPPPAPIARPGPIGRPSSTTPDKHKRKSKSPDGDVDQLATQLGSKALLDDSDIPLSASSDMNSSISAIGAPGSGRATLVSGFAEPKHDSFGLSGQGWSGFSPNMSNPVNWSTSQAARPGHVWPQTKPSGFGAIGGAMPNMLRTHMSRPVSVRILLTQACKQLCIPGSDGFVPIQNVLRHVEALKAPSEPPVSMEEMLAICDTEGNAQNGGGFFEVGQDASRGQMVKFEPDSGHADRGSTGDIGSPIVSHGQTVGFGGIGQGFGPPGRSF